MQTFRTGTPFTTSRTRRRCMTQLMRWRLGHMSAARSSLPTMPPPSARRCACATHTHTHTCAHSHIEAPLHVHADIYTRTYTHIYTHGHTDTRIQGPAGVLMPGSPHAPASWAQAAIDRVADGHYHVPQQARGAAGAHHPRTHRPSTCAHTMGCA
jgi:hypothetical protein